MRRASEEIKQRERARRASKGAQSGGLEKAGQLNPIKAKTRTM